MEENTEPKILRKIEPNHKYRIWRKDFNGKTFYNIMVSQKQYDDTEIKYYIPVNFKKGISVANETDIKIIKAIENLRENNKVEEKDKKYYPVFSYTITDFDIIENEEQKENEAYKKYQEKLNENEIEQANEVQDLPF
jgi:hypothetical protein